MARNLGWDHNTECHFEDFRRTFRICEKRSNCNQGIAKFLCQAANPEGGLKSDVSRGVHKMDITFFIAFSLTLTVYPLM
jgi:hypothetical protein